MYLILLLLFLLLAWCHRVQCDNCVNRNELNRPLSVGFRWIHTNHLDAVRRITSIHLFNIKVNSYSFFRFSSTSFRSLFSLFLSEIRVNMREEKRNVSNIKPVFFKATKQLPKIKKKILTEVEREKKKNYLLYIESNLVK